MCQHSTQTVIPGGCEQKCEGCQWSARISAEHKTNYCRFTWSVDRTGCTYFPNDTFSGTNEVPCNNQTTLSFFCDTESTCKGYEVTLTACACPVPPGGGGS